MGSTEILEVDDAVRGMLIEGKSSDDIQKYEREGMGMVTLWDDAMAKCKEGLTSLEEVLRITASD